VHGSKLYIGRADRKVSIYLATEEISELVAELDTDKTPVRMLVHGNTLVVAELGFLNALKCFAGIRCWPADEVEVFDITDLHAPVKKADLTFQEAEVLFGNMTGKQILLRQEDGFRVLQPEVSP
jgi:hypothetical protein